VFTGCWVWLIVISILGTEIGIINIPLLGVVIELEQKKIQLLDIENAILKKVALNQDEK